MLPRRSPSVLALALAALLAAPAAGQPQPRHWSTYLGGSSDLEEVQAVAAAPNGEIVVAGYTRSGDFPTTPGSFQPQFGGLQDAFVARLSADGSRLLASTFVGGSGGDGASFVHVAADGSIFIGGTTASSDFPVTADAFASPAGNDDAFVAQLDAGLSTVLYATTYGSIGDDRGEAFAVDEARQLLYLGGITRDTFPLPTTGSAFQRSRRGADAFLAVLDRSVPQQTSLAYGTYLGGGNFETDVGGMSVDGNDIVTMAGLTLSTDFPVSAGALQPTKGAGSQRDAFVVRIDPNQSGAAGLLYATYLGGSDNESRVRMAGGTGTVVHVALTTASTDLTTTPGAIQSTRGQFTDVYYAQVDTAASGSASLRYASWIIAGDGADGSQGIAITATAGEIAIFAHSGSTSGLPLSAGAFQTLGRGHHAVVVALGGGAPAIAYATYYRGCTSGGAPAAVGLHPSGDLLLAGSGGGTTSVPVTRGAFQTQAASNADAFVARLEPGAWRSFRTLGSSCAGSAGTPALAGTSPALLCRSLAVQASSLPAGQAGFLFFGPHTLWRGVPLPLPLAVIGGGSCALHVGMDVVVPLATGTGVATFQTGVPFSGTALLGLELSMQYAFLDMAANPLGLVMTNGLAAEVRW